VRGIALQRGLFRAIQNGVPFSFWYLRRLTGHAATNARTQGIARVIAQFASGLRDKYVRI
jgi:hypothetical protein